MKTSNQIPQQPPASGANTEEKLANLLISDDPIKDTALTLKGFRRKQCIFCGKQLPGFKTDFDFLDFCRDCESKFATACEILRDINGKKSSS